MTLSGGECEIRTHEGLATLPVFKTGAFNRSANSPFRAAGIISLIFNRLRYSWDSARSIAIETFVSIR